MKSIYVKIIIMIFLLTSFSTAQVSATYSLANGAVTNSGGIDYYEFDVMLTAGSASQFEVGQIYLNYNTAAFGSSIVTNGKVTVTKGTPLLDAVFGSGGDIGSYTISAVDNTSNILAIQNAWQKTDLGGGDTGYDLTNTLGTTASVWIHVKIEIANTAETSGISFNTTIASWDQQTYYFTSGDVDDKYSPVSVSGSLDEPLPVEMTLFIAEVTEKNKVLLNWETATEVNNFGFTVERKSATTLNDEEEWSEIGFVEGHGNSNSPKSYSYKDEELFGGNKFVYRLKQIDVDGTFEYSDEIEVEILPTKYELSQNYPNPFNPSTKINFSLPERGAVKLIVYDILGKKISELVNEEMEAGIYERIWNASQYSSGVYIYMLSVNGKRFVKKMNLLK